MVTNEWLQSDSVIIWVGFVWRFRIKYLILGKVSTTIYGPSKGFLETASLWLRYASLDAMHSSGHLRQGDWLMPFC